MSIDRAELEALKARQVAFFRARLVSPAAQAEWRDNLRAGARALLAARVGAIFDVDAVARALDDALTAELAKTAIRPALTSAIAISEAQLREDPRVVAEHLPAGERQKIDAFLDEPGLVPERLIREALENDAAEVVMRDVLYDALSEFNEKVNPFFADWGLPSLVKKLSPFGLGAMGKVFEPLRAEFDRRLEPEMRKFLKGFSRRALKNMADFTIEHGDEPEFVAIRKRMVVFLLDRKVAELAPGRDDRRAALAREIAIDVTLHLLTRDEARRQRRKILDMLFAVHKHQTLGEAIAGYGVTAPLDATDALANATWPALAAVLSSEAVQAWIGTLIEEFYEAEAGQGS